MLGFSRKTRAQQMRAELGTSWDHFLQAASHAASGVGSSVGPRAVKVRGIAGKGWESTASTFAPLAAAYREGAADAHSAALKLAKKSKSSKKGKQMSNRKVGMLIGLLAAGAAVGAAGALVMRRRKKQQWSDYDPSGALDSVSGDARSMLDRASSKADTAMDKAAHHANKAKDMAADKLEGAASTLRKTDFKAKADDAAEAVNEATDELASKFTSSKHNGRF